MPRFGPVTWAAAVVGGAAGLARGQLPPLRVTRHRVPWPELETRRRVLHLSDIHVGWSTPARLLDEVVGAAHAERADLVTLTGDYVNLSRTGIPRMQAFVERLPRPVVAVLGNHDHFVGAEAISAALTEAGAVVLRNRSVELVGLTVVGVDDGFTRSDDVAAAFRGLDAGAPALVLTHFPPTAVRIAGRGGRLILAGHTHAGQMDLPGRWTHRLARWAMLGGYLRGEYPLPDGARLYVSAGVGHARRGMRRGEVCHPELGVFDLDPDEDPAQ